MVIFYLGVIRPLAVAGFLKDAPTINFFDKDMACEGHKVTCGKHPGHYRICGGLDSDEIHGKRVAGTLHSRCSCPCKSRFIPSIDDTYEFSTGAAKADTAQSQVVEFPVLPGPIYDPQADNVTDTCKPEDNPLLNGVYIWTETTSAGHVFVSVHENNNIFLYTYGRYGRTDKSTFTGDGILDFFQDEDARKYYRYELYEMGARAFRIDDADPKIIRKFFENLWNGGVTPIQTPKHARWYKAKRPNH
ncbi:Pyocin large subunit [Klebsiella pneumoniae]|nr:Pyocin large subunit [Klebsiella pneumoniae]